MGVALERWSRCRPAGTRTPGLARKTNALCTYTFHEYGVYCVRVYMYMCMCVRMYVCVPITEFLEKHLHHTLGQLAELYTEYRSPK